MNTLSPTPRTEAVKDLKESLDKLAALQRRHALELEKLSVTQAREWEILAEGGKVDTCEKCEKAFVRTAKDVKNYTFECLGCRPTPTCSECDGELTESRIGEGVDMCAECEFAFRF